MAKSRSIMTLVMTLGDAGLADYLGNSQQIVQVCLQYLSLWYHLIRCIIYIIIIGCFFAADSVPWLQRPFECVKCQKKKTIKWQHHLYNTFSFID